ncbi:MAG: Asp-tRNA(Asn)/Glu-tRNA(Gln) amidotransferase subunit GatC, partial [Phycisphaerae bacterium]
MDRGEVQKVASLARLKLSDDELTTFGEQLTAILDYVHLLDEVDIDGVLPMPHAIDLQNVFRDDIRKPSLERGEALSNAPRPDGR